MARRDDFDRQFVIHEKPTTIDYQDIKSLYWNKYPYKIVIRDKLSRPPALQGFLDPEDNKNYDAWVEHYNERRKFYYARKRHCPEDGALWKSMNNGGTTFSFFFVHEADALKFIKKNAEFIRTVFRPNDEKQIAVLKTDKKLVLRDMLYYGKYRYCIEFKEQVNDESAEFLDNIITKLFSTPDPTRFEFSYSNRRRLFLNDEKDVVFVKLALHERIRKISEAILKEEID
jgi:hypothetical protein